MSHTKTQKKRDGYALRRQFNEKPGVMLGCTGVSHKQEMVHKG